MSTVHRNLTGADLHEPKGVETATSGQVYVANGSGSGVWTDATAVITNSAFTTGDLKTTWKTTADTGWLMYSYGTIGDGSSGASVRANADTSALFALLWANFNNTKCPVSGGRGASAVADYAAHKTIQLPDMSQRAIGIAGSYTTGGLTTRALGDTLGEETHTLVTAEIPSHTHSVTDPGHVHAISVPRSTSSNFTGNNDQAYVGSANSGVTVWSTASSTTGISLGSYGGGGAHNNMQPTAFLNLMIKL